MKQNRFVLAACVLLLFVLTACSRSPQTQTQTPTTSGSPTAGGPRITSESVVRFGAEPVDLPSGGAGQATVHVTVQNGYHVNANPPTYPYLKATELELTPPKGITVSFITYPNPIVKKFPFAENPIAIYEGDTKLNVMLTADRSVAKGASNLPGKLKVQACDDQVCYPPGEINVTVPVTIK
jgi:Disulphide bond corrector protein DsbC